MQTVIRRLGIRTSELWKPLVLVCIVAFAYSASASLFPKCAIHTDYLYTNNCASSGTCSKTVTTYGACTAWGWSCPGPGTGTRQYYSGTCVHLAGCGWSCENYIYTGSNPVACEC